MALKTYTTFEIGRICGVYPTTVINWVKQKKIPAFSTPGGHRRVRHEDLIEFLKEYNFPVPPELRADRKRVLIVDDDPAMGKLLLKAFEPYAETFDVRLCEDGVEALVAVGQRPPDLILLDVVMPVVDGSRVCATLKNNPDTKHIRIFVMTGKRLPERAERFLRRTADGFFSKPFDVRAMLRLAADRLKVTLPG